MKLSTSILLSLFLLIWLLPSTAFAFACACCAEPGQYSISTVKPSKDDMELIQRLRFQTADLFLYGLGEENVKGINPLGNKFSIQTLLNSKNWSFNFTDNNKKTGKLDLSKPISMVDYRADIPGNNDEETSGATTLYKEWRFKYRVQGASGIFKSAFAPATEYFLVLQGYGNNCPAAEDFKTYRLEITGKNADFAFYGKMGTPKPN